MSRKKIIDLLNKTSALIEEGAKVAKGADKSLDMMSGPSVNPSRMMEPVEQGFEEAYVTDKIRKMEEAADTMRRLKLVKPEAIERTTQRRFDDLAQESELLSESDDYAMALKQKQVLEAKPSLDTKDKDELERMKELMEMLRKYQDD